MCVLQLLAHGSLGVVSAAARPSLALTGTSQRHRAATARVPMTLSSRYSLSGSPAAGGGASAGAAVCFETPALARMLLTVSLGCAPWLSQ